MVMVKMKRLFSSLKEALGVVQPVKKKCLSPQGDVPTRVLECFKEKGTTHRMGFFSDKDLYQLSRVSKPYYQLVESELKKRAMNKIITHIVCGEEDAAKRMLENAPDRLLRKGLGVVPHGRKIVATPLQAALAADDERMCAMIATLFRKFETQGKFKVGQAQGIMSIQFIEQFPNGLKTDFIQEQEARLAMLKPTFDALAVAIATDADGGKSKIVEFRQTLCEKKKVTSGHLFDRALLIAAHRGLTENQLHLNSDEKQNIYWRQVIGSAQRIMPACYQQAYSSRDLMCFSREINSAIFNQQDGCGLGFDFDFNTFEIDRVNRRGGVRLGRRGPRIMVAPIPGPNHQGWELTLLSDKHKAFEAFRQDLITPVCQEEEIQEYCSIM